MLRQAALEHWWTLISLARVCVGIMAAASLGLTAPALARADDERPSLGVRYHLERVEVRGNVHTRREVILARVPFTPGQVLDVDDPDIERTRLRLLGTGYFSKVELSLRRGRHRGWVVLVVWVAERPTLRVREIALGAEDGTVHAGVDVGDSNLLGLGVHASAAVVGSIEQQAIRLRLLDPAFLGTRAQLEGTALYNRAHESFDWQGIRSSDCPAADYRCTAWVDYDRGGLTLGIGQEVADALRLRLGYRFEIVRVRSIPAAASRRLGAETVPVEIELLPGTSLLSTIAAGVERDTRDDPFLPSRGMRAWGDVEVGSRLTGSSYAYARFTSGLEAFAPLAWGHVVKLDLWGGFIVGDAPLFEKFFMGDLSDLLPSRVLDLSFDDRPPPNLLGTSIVEMRYEDIAARIGLEYAIPLHRARRIVYGVDFFAGAGLYTLASADTLAVSPVGYRGLSRIPVDLTFDLGFRLDTEIGVFGLSFSNLIGLVPFGSEAR